MKSKIIVCSDFFKDFYEVESSVWGRKKRRMVKSGVITQTLCRLIYWKTMDLIQSQPVPKVTNKKYPGK